ncbi:MAG: hypothetical protein IJR55_00190 [Clostridia bacterium]|nr:hypothetical protein [Clostridia bacterium]
MNQNSIPDQYKPIGMWGYFGYQILFSIPIVGFIFLIVFSLSSSNINRRNFARSYFCIIIIALIIVAIVFITGGLGGVVDKVTQMLSSVGN